MEISRDLYLNKLVRKKHNGLIKIVTGIRRCGKSFLLNTLFKNHLINSGVSESHIIEMAFDNIVNKKYRDPMTLYNYVSEKIVDEEMYYVLLDEVQLVKEFEDVLNGFLHIKNVDVYVTGSNAKFLSKDIITEFRGRGDEIHMQPLSFKEFYSAYGGSKEDAWKDFVQFGGLPKILDFKVNEDKIQFLKDLFKETYINDIIERNSIKNTDELEELVNILSSSIGSLTNPHKLSDTFKSVKNVSIKSETLSNYIDYLADAFIIDKATRYDIKGKKYIDSPFKYYFEDMGLRNARINFRQLEETHIMENIIFNELRTRGFNIDVGAVPYNYKNKLGVSTKTYLEVDFVCNKADKRYYIQSALTLPTKEKLDQEQNSLLRINDSFKKIIIVKDSISTYYNEDGVLIMNLFDFLLNENSLDY